MESDSQLVARAQSGDQQAFAELVRRYSALVFRLAVSILGREFIPEAEDVAQEVFLKVHHAIESFRGEAVGPLRRVVLRIAGNRQTAPDGRHLKDIAALLPAHHRDGGAGGVHNAVKASIHHCLEVFRAHLLERRNLSVTGIIDEDIQPPEGLDR